MSQSYNMAVCIPLLTGTKNESALGENGEELKTDHITCLVYVLLTRLQECSVYQIQLSLTGNLP